VNEKLLANNHSHLPLVLEISELLLAMIRGAVRPQWFKNFYLILSMKHFVQIDFELKTNGRKMKALVADFGRLCIVPKYPIQQTDFAFSSFSTW
jgi:hypothetical protein